MLRLWRAETEAQPLLSRGVAIAAVGGYGRGLLFPYSDVDLLFCVEKARSALAAQPIRRLSQQLWDCGLQVSLGTRGLRECERFEATNPEFGISLLDLRDVGGDAELLGKLRSKAAGKMRQRDAKAIAAELVRLTRERHAKYGDTLFHLEPNIKECPGGLRDANVAEWLRSLRKLPTQTAASEFQQSLAFLASVRCFLHYRNQRDDNTLDWQAQDAAAHQEIGLGRRMASAAKVDAAYWMRAYFRHARIVERALLHEAEGFGQRLDTALPLRRIKVAAESGFKVEAGRIELDAAVGNDPTRDPANEPEIVLDAFSAMARSGARLTAESEERIADAIPLLSANLEEGPGLWRKLAVILTAERAGTLRCARCMRWACWS